MKKLLSMLVVILVFSLLFGCNVTNEEVIEKKIVPVHTQNIQMEKYNNTLDYLGTIEADIIKQYSFKVSGKINDLYVSNGDSIRNNQVLATLESEDYSLALQNAQASFNKATSAFEYAEKYYLTNQKLYDEGAISEYQFDSVKTEYEIAKSNYESAQILYATNLNQLESTTLKSDFTGYVLDILFEEGELVSSGYPVIIASNNIPKVTIGLSPDDLIKIDSSMDVLITINNQQFPGILGTVSKLPDSQTRTYTATINFDSSNFVIGQFAEVSIILSQNEGILVPISSIQSDGNSYVYIVSDKNQAVKKYIKLGTVINDLILVEGLDINDSIIISNLDNIHDLDLVEIINSEE